MSQQLLQQRPLGFLIPSSVEANDSSAPLQTVPGHLELVHGVDVLNVHLDGRTVGGFGCPEVEIFVTTGFEVEGVVAGVKVGEFVEEVKRVFGVEFGV